MCKRVTDLILQFTAGPARLLFVAAYRIDEVSCPGLLVEVSLTAMKLRMP